jgi:hypothetical protein
VVAAQPAGLPAVQRLQRNHLRSQQAQVAQLADKTGLISLIYFSSAHYSIKSHEKGDFLQISH